MTRFISCLCVAFVALCFLSEEQGQRAYALDDVERKLISDAFMETSYSYNYDQFLTFDDKTKFLELPFASNEEANRACLDVPIKQDCSPYASYELIVKVDKMEAIGYTTLYFHSGDGWYGMTGDSKRYSDGRLVVRFNIGEVRPEGSPGTLAEVDSVRLAFWRGASVDATVEFVSFKAIRSDFAILDGYPTDSPSYIASTADLFEKSGVFCERVDVKHVTLDKLKQYRAVVLPVGGDLSDETIDGLCQFVDAGGFLFVFYDSHPKLLAKLGVVNEGFCRPSQEGLSIDGMRFDEDSIRLAKERGLSIPSRCSQDSWNYYVVSCDDKFKSAKTSVIYGDNKAHVLAYWSEEGKATRYPSLILSGSGLYCSHVFDHIDVANKKGLVASIIADISPEYLRNVAQAEWISIFDVGVYPEDDRFEAREKTLNFVKKELEKRNIALSDVLKYLDKSNAPGSLKALTSLVRLLSEIRDAKIDDFARSLSPRQNEARLWWEHSGCGIWRGDWDRTMKELSDAGFNGIVSNMLWGGQASYKSKVLPNDSKAREFGDQIEQAVAAGKKYGVEVHVWMVCFNASNSSKEFLEQMRREGRLQHTKNGEEQPWLCPSSPLNRQLQLDALKEVAFNYDVDGIHFDYIRYPDENSCFCDGCRERFAESYYESTGQRIEGDLVEAIKKDKAVDSAWRQWRCDQITALVREVNEAVRAKKPNIQISAAVFQAYPWVKDSVGQDWGLWIEKGYLDFVCPMNYTEDPFYFEQLIKKQLPITQGKVPLYPGIGYSSTGNNMRPDEALLQANIAQRLGTEGFIIFNLDQRSAEKTFPEFKKGITSEKTKRAN